MCVNLSLRMDLFQGAERFSSYSGYGRTFNFTGDFKDDSEVNFSLIFGEYHLLRERLGRIKTIY